MLYNLIIACLGISANFCVVVLITMSPKRGRKPSIHVAGEDNTLLNRNQQSQDSSSSVAIVMSDVCHTPTAILLIVSSQLLILSFFNFLLVSRASCCVFLDIFGVLLSLSLVTMVAFVGVDQSTKIKDVQEFFEAQIHQVSNRLL